MAQKDEAQSRILDLDKLVCETPRLKFDDGNQVQFRDVTSADVRDFLAELDAIGEETPDDEVILDLVAKLKELCAEPDEAGPFLELLPVNDVWAIVTWLTSAKKIVFDVSDGVAVAFRLEDKIYHVKPLTVGVFRQVTEERALAGADDLGDDDEAEGRTDMSGDYDNSMELFAARIEGLSLEELESWPNTRRRTLLDYVQRVWERHDAKNRRTRARNKRR